MLIHFRNPSRPLLGCIAALTCAAAFAAQPKILTFPAKVAAPAALTLLAFDGKSGRRTPIYDNYRPQIVFSGDSKEVTCWVHIPKPTEKIDPGTSAEVGIECLDAFRVVDGQRGFAVFEGNRKVAVGTLN
jgi:translation elongation factor EF-Tu-like GTPase